MKMEFIKPQIEVIEISTGEILMTSLNGVYSKDSGFDVGYGGVDENGEYDPD